MRGDGYARRGPARRPGSAPSASRDGDRRGLRRRRIVGTVGRGSARIADRRARCARVRRRTSSSVGARADAPRRPRRGAHRRRGAAPDAGGAQRAMTSLQIAGRRVGPGEPCYVIAEAGSNHDGSLDQGLALIDAAAAAGVDAVKFQAIQYDELWVRELETREHREFYTAIELPEAWLPRLAARAASKGIHFLCSPTYLASVALID